jgi:hypothetical protein
MPDTDSKSPARQQGFLFTRFCVHKAEPFAIKLYSICDYSLQHWPLQAYNCSVHLPSPSSNHLLIPLNLALMKTGTDGAKCILSPWYYHRISTKKYGHGSSG